MDTFVIPKKRVFLANLYNLRSFYIHVILHVIMLYTCYIIRICIRVTYIRVIYILCDIFACGYRKTQTCCIYVM